MEENISQTEPTEIQNQPKKGWSKVILLAVLGMVLIGGFFFAGYWYGKNSNLNPPVGGPTLTPVITSLPTFPPEPTFLPSPSEAPAKEGDETVGWKSYKNEEYEITFKYPQEWTGEKLPFENYKNPNKERGLRDECLINYGEEFVIKKDIQSKWNPLVANFGIEISVINPEEWSLERWLGECKSDYSEKLGYHREFLKKDNKDGVLLYREGDPGNSGQASVYLYFFENASKFYNLYFINHIFVEGIKEDTEKMLETVSFF